jgi:hypothetical protein
MFRKIPVVVAVVVAVVLFVAATVASATDPYPSPPGLPATCVGGAASERQVVSSYTAKSNRGHRDIAVVLRCGKADPSGYGVRHVRVDGNHVGGDTNSSGIKGVIQTTLDNRPSSINNRGKRVYKNEFSCAANGVPLYTTTFVVVVGGGVDSRGRHDIITFYIRDNADADRRSFDQEVWHCTEQGGDVGHW